MPEIGPGLREDGRVWSLEPMLYGKCRLSLGNPGATVYDDQWCYDDLDTAEQAILDCDGTSEPEGWFRHPMTGRRRPDGNKEKEYQRW